MSAFAQSLTPLKPHRRPFPPKATCAQLISIAGTSFRFIPFLSTPHLQVKSIVLFISAKLYRRTSLFSILISRARTRACVGRSSSSFQHNHSLPSLPIHSAALELSTLPSLLPSRPVNPLSIAHLPLRPTMATSNSSLATAIS